MMDSAIASSIGDTYAAKDAVRVGGRKDGIKQILNQLHVALGIPDMQISERNDANVLPAGAQIMCNGLHFLHHLSNRSPPIRRHK